MGRLLDHRDKADLRDNTIVVYVSDNGYFIGEHGWIDKKVPYDESIRTPLLVRFPERIKPGSVNKDLVQNLDFGPTFLDFAGLQTPQDMQGESFRKILQGKTPRRWRESIYYHYYEYPAVHSVKRHYGVRTKRYKLIHFYNDIDEWELYDMKKDPDELNNVYNDSAYAKVVKELKTELKRLREKYKDDTGKPV